MGNRVERNMIKVLFSTKTALCLTFDPPCYWRRHHREQSVGDGWDPGGDRGLHSHAVQLHHQNSQGLQSSLYEAVYNNSRDKDFVHSHHLADLA